MSPALTTFLFEAVNFLLLAGGLAWLLFKPVRAALADRRQRAAQEAQAIKEREADVEQARAELRQRQAAFDAELAGLRKTRLDATEREAAALIDDARHSAERERERAERLLGEVDREHLQHLADAAAAAAGSSVRQLLEWLQGPELDASLVRAACREVASLGSRTPGPVVVESPRPLADADRALVTAALGNGAARVEFRVKPELGAGIRITTAAGLVDASAAGLADHARRALTETLHTSNGEGDDGSRG